MYKAKLNTVGEFEHYKALKNLQIVYVLLHGISSRVINKISLLCHFLCFVFVFNSLICDHGLNHLYHLCYNSCDFTA